MRLDKLPLDRFMSDLGSARPAPGGGAAAAVCGALGLSLYEMVLRINAKKDASKLKTAKNVQKLTKKCLEIVTKDAAAFERISHLYKTGQKGAGYQSALKNGAKVPLEIIHMARRALQGTRQEYASTSSWLKSDLAEAEILLKSAMQAAQLNVEINLKSITDKAFVDRVREAMR